MTTNTKANVLREMLKDRSTIKMGAGVHDAISAKLAEKAGFDFIWISGLGLSSVNGVPDGSLLTFGDFLPAFSMISQSVHIPVIADCDNGYGDAANASFTAVQIINRTNLAGICIEDNPYPKRNSLVSGHDRLLVTQQEMVHKISAIRDSVGDDLFVIGRCESLIAGEGIDDALLRAKAYVSAGADAILIHTKDKLAQEVAMISEKWDYSAPLVIVPTAFPQISSKQLHGMGYSMAIYANQALRAALTSIQYSYKLIKEDKANDLEMEIMKLSELFDLTSTKYLSYNEEVKI
ncbi:isocitrate lyase/PEP mutase family protein [Paenibacillus sp. YYML68]|uniref:isocitrate lyase/PEP mutase family protein n=1 Tax=Paenibacillus sp. YYML68 TaxID=2909250 RepID=UPI002490A984|nr:isocitrate lyase/PEP mutase family protein [Paenibacillus sp. YYML68]